MDDHTIRIYGASWCPDTIRARRLLESRQIPYDWHDVDVEMDSRAYVEGLHHGLCRVPTIIFLDGSMLVEPSDAELKQKLSIVAA
jgi:glutaredoxin